MQNNVVFYTTVILLCSTLQGCGGSSKKSSSPSPTNPVPENPAPPSNPAPEDPVPQVVINEVVAKASDGGPDWVELYNPSNTEQDLGDYVLKDNDDENQFVIPSDTVIAAGGYLLLQRDETSSAGFDFGLGKADSVRLFDAQGQLIDSTQWNDGQAPIDKSWGRLPNGVGQFQTLEPTTAQADNSTASASPPTEPAPINPQPTPTNPVVINEVVAKVTDGSDWVEFHNTSNTEQDISGYVMQDNNDENRYAFASGTVIAANGYLLLARLDDDGTGQFDFGLGSTDSVRLFNAAGELIDSTQWTNGGAPIDKSWGRLPNGIGQFQTLEPPTPGTANSAVAEDDAALTNVREQYPEYVYDSSHASDYLFDQGQLRRYDLWLNESSLDQIDADPTAEEYVEGALVFEDQVISRVGIRYKGSLGAFLSCVNGPDLFDPSGEKTCTKLPMKVKIDWNSEDDVFYGVKKLQFHAMNLDPTMMHERLGYWLFNQFEVPAPRSVHAELYINGQFNGLFALVEQIDDVFVKDRFGQDGNLYKEVWPLQTDGTPTPEQIIRQGLKTNTDNADVSEFREFAKEVAEIQTDFTTLGQPNEADKAIMQKNLAPDQLVRTLVVDRMSRNDDGFYHWYCDDDAENSEESCGNHNFYLYQDTENQKIHIIPWDLDAAFENLSSEKSPVTYIEDDWNAISNNCDVFLSGIFQIGQRSAACDKLMGAFTLYEQQFNELKQLFIEQLFNSETIDQQIDTWAEQIQLAVQQANTNFDDQPSVTEWQQAVEQLKQDIANSLVDEGESD